MDKRKDSRMEQLIRNGILTEMQYGTVHAWAYLLRNRIDEALILRVLLSANRRADDTADLLSLRKRLIAGVCGLTPAGFVRPAGAIPRTTAIAIVNDEMTATPRNTAPDMPASRES